MALASSDEFERVKVGGLETRIAATEHVVLPVAAPSTDIGAVIVAEMRREEIRAQLRPLDALEREVIYLDATDPEIVDAIESAPASITRARPDALPKFVPFVNPERRRENILARAEAKDPVRAGELRDLERIARVYRTVLATLRAGILEAVPSLRADPDPILAMA